MASLVLIAPSPPPPTSSQSLTLSSRFSFSKSQTLANSLYSSTVSLAVSTVTSPTVPSEAIGKPLEENLSATTLAMKQIREWIDHWDNVSKFNFNAFHLDGLLALRTTKINWNLLKAAVRFWDFEDHVFRFNMVELCPTIEEFSAILGCEPRAAPIVPSCHQRHRATISKVLGLPLDAIPPFIQDNYWVDMRRLVERFRHAAVANVDQSFEKLSALAFCLIGEFLLCSRRPGFADARIFDLLDDVKKEKSLIPMVLAETFHGLDALSRGETNIFQGSPLLLQVWLMDHMGILSLPTVATYGPGDYVGRKLQLFDCQTEKEWTYFLSRKDGQNIRWNCHWWRCPYPLLRSPNRDHIFLVGLRSVSFYRGERVVSQFGLMPMIPSSGNRPFKPVNVAPSIITKAIAGLDNAHRADETFVRFQTFEMPKAYHDWLKEKVQDKEVGLKEARKAFLKDFKKTHKRRRSDSGQ